MSEFTKLNQEYNIKANQLALGEKEETKEIFIKGVENIGNNTFFPELLGQGKTGKTNISIIRLDEYLLKNNLNNVKLIKIDMEGFKFLVLKGMERCFEKCSKNNSCPIVVSEVVPEVYPKIGHKLEDLFSYMAKFSYHPYELINRDGKVNIEVVKNNYVTDILFKHG